VDAHRVAKSAGLVAIYSGDVLPAEAKARIAAESGEHFLDAAIPATQGAETEQQIAQRVIAFAQRLLLKTLSGQPKRVN